MSIFDSVMEKHIAELIREIRERLDTLETLVLTSTATNEHTESILLTPKGKVRGLNSKVLAVLRNSVEPIGSAEICKRLYSPSYGVSYDAFLRKVVVAVSYLHKNGKRIEASYDENGKALWSLPVLKTTESMAWDKLIRI